MIIQMSVSWMNEAACKGRTELFYPKYSERPEATARRVAKAKKVCQTCPVMEKCRDAARQNGEYGVWGGETDEERYAAGFFNDDPVIKKRLRADAARQRRREARMKRALERSQ